MAKPRRARTRWSRVLIPVVLVVVAAVVVGWQTNFSWSDLTGRATSNTPSPTPTPSGTATPTADSSAEARKAAEALKSCQTKVKAADAVIKAADTGVGHWSEHVEAQTKANRDKITVTMLDKVFDETRKAGPKDQERYSGAREAFEDEEGSCKAVTGAPAEVASDLKSCRERAEAQEAVMKAAEPAMEDWKEHLQQMKHSQDHVVPDAEEIWLKAWRAAPRNIDPFDEALEKFEDDAPRCAGKG